MKFVLDVGGTYTKYAYIENNQIYEKGVFDTVYRSAETFCDEVRKRMTRDAEGIALSIGGFYRSGVYLGFGSIPYVKENQLIRALEDFSLPIAIENDCICAGLCERTIGSLQGIQNAVVVILGSAMGSCLLLDGKVHRGSHHHASMLFQMPEEMNVETGVTVCDYHSNTLALNQEYGQCYQRKINFKMLEEKMHAGDAVAAGVISRYCQAVANKIVCAALVVDPEKVVIGGGVSHSRIIMDTIAKNVNQFYEEKRCSQDFSIERCKFEDCNLLGAAMLSYV